MFNFGKHKRNKNNSCHKINENNVKGNRYFFSLKILTFSYLFACVRVFHGSLQVWRTEANLCESVLPFYYVGPGNQTQVLRVGGKPLSPLSHLSSPFFSSSQLDYTILHY